MNVTLRLAAALLGLLLLGGCETVPSRWHQSTAEAIAAEMTQAAGEPSPGGAGAPSAATGTAQAAPPAETQPPEHRFDLSANNTPARALFMSLMEGTPYSLVLHPDVEGTVSLQLKNVTVEEALEAIRQVYGYDYRREGNRFYILGRGMQTRVYPVNYLNFNRKGQSNTRVSSGELSDIIAYNAGNAAPSLNNPNRQQGIKVETVSESDFWATLKQSLEDLIGKEDGRKVVVNPQAGIVIVHAMPAELNIVQRYLDLAQSTVNRQVILEAKIIEVELNNGFQSGINWAALASPGDADILFSQVGGGTLLSGSGKSATAGNTGDIAPGAGFPPLDATAVSAFGGMFSIAIQDSDFSAFFEFLQSQGDVHILSSPRVSTVNNQKAVIKVGGDEFFVTGVSNEQITTGNITTLNPQVELTPFFSGIALDVFPRIDDKEHVILHIHPTISEVTEKNKSFVVSGEDFDLPLANRAVRESDNVVRARSGQIIVIGGLMKEASTEDNASVPLLGDLPVVGHLFRHKRITRIKKELVILLRPSILDGDGAWVRDVRLTRQRIEALGQAPAVRKPE